MSQLLKVFSSSLRSFPRRVHRFVSLFPKKTVLLEEILSVASPTPLVFFSLVSTSELCFIPRARRSQTGNFFYYRNVNYPDYVKRGSFFFFFSPPIVSFRIRTIVMFSFPLVTFCSPGKDNFPFLLARRRGPSSPSLLWLFLRQTFRPLKRGELRV